MSAYLFCQIVKQIWFESPAVILYISYLDEPLNRLFLFCLPYSGTQYHLFLYFWIQENFLKKPEFFIVNVLISMSTLCLEKGKKIHLFLVCNKSRTTATRPKKKINVVYSGSRPLAPNGDVFIIPNKIMLILFRLNLNLYILNKLSL